MMCERVKLFSKFLKNGGLYPCNIFTDLVFERPEELLLSIKSVSFTVSLRKRRLCNCFAQLEFECECSPIFLLNHFVFIISSFRKQFDLAKQIIDALIDRGCDLNEIDEEIGTVLHSCILCIDNDIRMNATQSEYNLSLQCIDYLLSLNKCDINLDVGSNKFSKAKGTPLALAVERELINVVEKLIAVGVNVPKTTINQSSIPETMNHKLVQIYDLLFMAGYQFDSDFKTIRKEFLVNENRVKFLDWIRMKKCEPMSLKSLSRIVLRNYLKTRINDENLNILMPHSLKMYLKFQTD